MDENTGTLNQERETHEGWQKKTALFLSSQSLSLFGSMLVQYAIIWYVTLTTQSGVVLTISTISGFLPQIAISLFAGVWADRYPRKFLIIAADLLTAVSTLILAIFFLFGYRELWLIFLVSGIRSIGAGIQMPAVSALLPQIVPADRLMKVNSINGTIQPFVMIVTPVLAGVLLSFSRLEAIFFIDIVTAILAVGLLLILKVPPLARVEAEVKTGYFADFKAGLVYIGQNRVIKNLLVFFAFVFFLVVPVAFLSPLLVTRSYGTEVWRLTANEVTFFGGSILGGVIMTLWGGFDNRFRTIGLSCILWAVIFTALGLANNFNVYLVFMTLAGIPMPFWGASTTTLLQEIVVPEMQGRVFGVQSLIMNTVMPVGMLFFGPVADLVSIEVLLIVSSVLMAIPGLWIFFYRQPVIAGSPPQASDDQGARVYDASPGD
ncbi:MAG: MFS transporter [Chloroflexi bacterium]|nr:MAG: MFS transporter [Chloroflexota bacterium]